ncbi:unnamed protein product [Protopolystoma xenopodis]|uniref:Uncharacterized protein n=1 Tax=Protopolystoma xenopodis TaxID=117903 RepID=A0A3S5CH59_9PLAT|nr:unnamed protein product [Protopolystoma xenopodis]
MGDHSQTPTLSVYSPSPSLILRLGDEMTSSFSASGSDLIASLSSTLSTDDLTEAEGTTVSPQLSAVTLAGHGQPIVVSTSPDMKPSANSGTHRRYHNSSEAVETKPRAKQGGGGDDSGERSGCMVAKDEKVLLSVPDNPDPVPSNSLLEPSFDNLPKKSLASQRIKDVASFSDKSVKNPLVLEQGSYLATSDLLQPDQIGIHNPEESLALSTGYSDDEFVPSEEEGGEEGEKYKGNKTEEQEEEEEDEEEEEEEEDEEEGDEKDGNGVKQSRAK